MTVQAEVSGPQQQGKWDPLIEELHALRHAAGTPSYDALTKKLIAQRINQGQDPHAARIAKSSVHDAFRFGRTRINEGLVRELVQAMDGNPTMVKAWVARCSQPSAEASAPPPVAATQPEPLHEPMPHVAIAAPTLRQQAVLLLGCVVLNLLGREFVDFFHLPFYLDMVGTAVVAFALGPWRAVGVGVGTNVVGAVGSGWISLPFALVNITGALVWGYGMRRWRMGRTLPRFLTLNVVAAFACTVVAVPIIVATLGRDLRVGHDAITQTVGETIDVFLVAVGFSNLLTSLGDKLVSGFVALVIVSALPLALRRGVDLVAVTHDRTTDPLSASRGSDVDQLTVGR